MDSKQRANELVNMYYNANAKNQNEAIAQAENAIFTTMCQMVDSLYNHVWNLQDFDADIIKSQIQSLKWRQEIAAELQNMKTV